MPNIERGFSQYTIERAVLIKEGIGKSFKESKIWNLSKKTFLIKFIKEWNMVIL